MDSLKRILPALRNNSRIDCLNEISAEFTLLENKDSAIHYANLAGTEAKISDYAHGNAIALTNQAKIVFHFDKDFIKIELLSKEALHWFEKTSTKTGVDVVYDLLWVAVFAQGKFEEATGYIQTKLDYCKQTKNNAGVWDAVFSFGIVYGESGDYEKSFEYFRQSYQLGLEANNPMFLSPPLYGIGDLYRRIEDYATSLLYYRQAFQIDDRNNRHQKVARDWDIWVKMQFCELFSNLNQFDSAWYYYKLFKPGNEDTINLRAYWVSTGESHFMQKNYKAALENYTKSLASNLKMNDRNQIMRILLDIARTHDALHNDTAALRYAREGFNLAVQTRARQFIRDAYKILYIVYDRRNQTDSANLYFRKYIAVKDSVANDLTKAKFAAYNYEQKIELLDKEKQLQLNQTAQQKKILIIGIAALCLIGLILFRYLILKRKSEKQRLEHELELQQLESQKTKVELQHQATELEMQALRAQMNPHFIFNSLNSINRFILQNNKAQASEYLTKFSKLVRMILQNSQDSLITLESELESLELYLNLEALRFNYHFDYKITVPKDLDISVLKVPPLILQPYVENAIWHGLMHKEEKGQLDVEVSEEDSHLFFKITDNGIGREKAAAIASKSATQHKSMGLRITADRIAIIQNSQVLTSPVTINDLVDADGTAAGTEVVIKMPVIYD